MDIKPLGESTVTDSTTPVPRTLISTSLTLNSTNTIEGNTRKLPSSVYKGVLPQPNGRWGAQIYEKHKRLWLGTFNTEDDAAKAYDVAAKRFKGPYAITNIKHQEQHERDLELAFLNMHSEADIVDMLRKHTYNQELEQGMKNYNLGMNKNKPSASTCTRVHLFDKVLTPSDVGRLNRLVIPKQYAENYIVNNNERTSSNSNIKDVLLSAEDGQGKVWRFRYSYWESSQSYVVTKGWIQFVKEMGLKAGDVVSFERSTCEDKKLYIGYKVSTELNLKHAEDVKVVKLFGVNIFKAPVNTVAGSIHEGRTEG